MVESSALLKRHTPKGYRGFESPPLRALSKPFKTKDLQELMFSEGDLHNAFA